ncbi:unnamed protein product [Orchesella dallaii]|uniref:Reverse transcriptase domain-containing protein n=1 Tax=Orchesella dallaii TaxID=48710 RepID=A0ABP1QNB9_9HEXA
MDDTVYKWKLCAACGLIGTFLKPAGIVNGKRLYLHYDWKCVHCLGVQPDEDAQLSILPFHSEESLPQEEPIEADNQQISHIKYFPKGWKLAHLNVNGLKSKLAEIHELLISDSRIMVLCLTETKLSQLRDDSNRYEVSGYNLIRFDRTNREGGGTAVFVNKSISYEIIEHGMSVPSEVECHIFKLNYVGIKSIYLAVLYIPPHCVNEAVFIFLESLFQFLRSTKGEIVVLGDLNIDLLSRSQFSLKMKSLSKEFNLTQKILFPTRISLYNRPDDHYSISSSLLDHIYVSDPNLYSNAGGFEYAGSDHQLVFVIRKKESIKVLQNVIAYRCYKNIDSDQFTKELNNINWSFLNCNNIDDSIKMFENVVLTYLNAHAPIKKRTVKSIRQPWFNNNLLGMCKNRDKLKHEFNSTRDSKLYILYKKLRNLVNSATCRSEKLHFRSKFEDCVDSVDVWNTMNELINFRQKSRRKICKLVDSSGNVLEDDSDICSQLASEFIIEKSVSDLNELDDVICKYTSVFHENNPDYNHFEISHDEVNRAITKVKKSKDLDSSIPRRIYRQFSESLLVPLALIFNLILNSCVVPKSFKTAVCTPLYKGRGRITSSLSYRAIYGLSYLTKLFEFIIYNRLLEMVDDVLIPNQHGFRAKRSCETAVSCFTQSIYDIIDKKNGKAMAVFVDFSKAFDTINHKILLEKLMNKFDNRVEPYMVNLLRNYFTDRKFNIENGSFISKFFNIKAGTAAGSCLGPLIFSLFINDICEGLTLPFLLYADDLVFFVDATNYEEGLVKLNDCYAKLKQWCLDNDLVINSAKTKAMFFHKSSDHRSRQTGVCKIELDNTEIEVVSSFKYLGVDIDSTLSFKEHLNRVEKKMNAALGRMYRFKRFFTENLIKTFISCYVVSIPDYCLSVWAIHKESQLELLQSKINRYLVAYFYPVLYKRCNNSKQATLSKAKISLDNLLLRIDLLTISERRKLSLVKIAGKCLVKKTFENWLIPSPRTEEGCLPMFVVSRANSVQYKDSIKWNLINNWNAFLQKCNPPPETGINGFVSLCQSELLKARNSEFVT